MRSTFTVDTWQDVQKIPGQDIEVDCATHQLGFSEADIQDVEALDRTLLTIADAAKNLERFSDRFETLQLALDNYATQGRN